MIHVQKTTEPPSTINNERTYNSWQTFLDNNGFTTDDNSTAKDRRPNLYNKTGVYQALCKTYHHKCAFCECNQSRLLPNANTPKKAPKFTIEHYRPIKLYYWLIYSWDNLLPTCSACNNSKGHKFEILGTAASPQTTADARLHNLAAAYHGQENPKMLHPEIDPPSVFEQIQYTQDGKMFSGDERCKYTIDVLQLNTRKDIDTLRKTVWDDFVQQTQSAILANNDELPQLIEAFVQDADTPENEFLGFRRFAIQQNWLTELILRYL